MLLLHGFRVRGVGRSADKAHRFTELLKQRFGAESFEFAQIKDFAIDGAFANALNGESAKCLSAAHKSGH